jgi:hypothetical protein
LQWATPTLAVEVALVYIVLLTQIVEHFLDKILPTHQTMAPPTVLEAEPLGLTAI